MRRKHTTDAGDVKTRRPRAGKAPAAEPRERILREATRLIAQRGFGAISVNDVALAVGISKQALLYHYPSREALHAAVVDSLIEHSNRHLLLLLAVFTGKGEERLERAMAQIREFFDTDPHAARVLLRELLDGDREQLTRLRQGVEPWLRLMADTLRQGQQEGRIRLELDPEAAVVHVGTLLLTTFALLPLEGWAEMSDAEWRERRLGEVVPIIEHYLFTDGSPAPGGRGRSVSPRRQAK
ncbi:TetR/AcrR family transcriptional regulator [Archangium violaceum]|uniref:TetR/AcrR family transcriptional regulator n=1 Tax=Archangium violaceum TaxID=83451 RepID=UPI002B28472A|nr:TetR/AcrR family transcriptional regulator [Archangium violaceum]